MLSVIYSYLPMPLISARVAAEDIAIVICVGLLCWSAGQSVVIIRNLQTRTVDKLFWLGLTVIPFMLLIFVLRPDIF